MPGVASSARWNIRKGSRSDSWTMRKPAGIEIAGQRLESTKAPRSSVCSPESQSNPRQEQTAIENMIGEVHVDRGWMTAGGHTWSIP